MYQKEMFEILLVMLHAASPKIVEGLRESVAKLAKEAKETPNPWDDMLTMVMGIIIGRPGEPVDGR